MLKCVCSYDHSFLIFNTNVWGFLLMDQITEVFYNLLTSAKNKKLSWEPSLLSGFQFVLNGISQLNVNMAKEPDEPSKLIENLKNAPKTQNFILENNDIVDALKLVFGHQRLKGDRVPEEFLDKGGDTTHPAKFDWRSVKGKNYVSKVKHQGLCSSCVPFGVAATIEASARIEKNIPVTLDNEASILDLSEQQMFFTNEMFPLGCNCTRGWFIEDALEFSRKTGVVPEAIYTYNPYNPFFKPPILNLPKGWEKQVTKISGYKAYTDPERMKHHLSTKGPLIASIDIHQDLLFYRKGIYENEVKEKFGAHCICCIGYDDKKGAWLCKNSWGHQWGDSGYIWIKYGNSKVDDEMWGISGFDQIYVGA
jgi:C1A family cysteine protease